MGQTYTIDASVFVSAIKSGESDHPASKRLLTKLRDEAAFLIVPTLLLPEVASALGRGKVDEKVVRDIVSSLSRLPNLQFVSLDFELAIETSHVAVPYGLRGSDAVYVAVALRAGTTLVTLDTQQRERGANALTTHTPAQVLDELEQV
jgi:predicted nucleic acid-binding protein